MRNPQEKGNALSAKMINDICSAVKPKKKIKVNLLFIKRLYYSSTNRHIRLFIYEVRIT